MDTESELNNLTPAYYVDDDLLCTECYADVISGPGSVCFTKRRQMVERGVYECDYCHEPIGGRV